MIEGSHFTVFHSSLHCTWSMILGNPLCFPFGEDTLLCPHAREIAVYWALVEQNFTFLWIPGPNIN